MLDMKKRRIIGIISIIAGIIFLFEGNITGAVISTFIGTSISFIIGLVLLIGGIGLILANSLEITVYNRPSEGATEIDDRYFINDKGFRSSNSPDTSLRQFKQVISEMKSEDEEIYNLLRKEYVHPLQKLANEDSEDKAKIAREFLSALDSDVSTKKRYVMPKEERKKIKDTFDNWNGHPTPRQRKILGEYGMDFEIASGRYNKIRHEKGTFPVSKTPTNEGNAAERIASDVIRHYEENQNAA